MTQTEVDTYIALRKKVAPEAQTILRRYRDLQDEYEMRLPEQLRCRFGKDLRYLWYRYIHIEGEPDYIIACDGYDCEPAPVPDAHAVLRYSGSDGRDGWIQFDLPIEWLYDPDWETKARAILLDEIEKLFGWQEEEIERSRQRELAQLARLQEKYGAKG